MKKHILLSLVFIFFSLNCYGWQHGVTVGYAIKSLDADRNQYNSGFYTNVIFYRFNKADKMLNFHLEASMGSWHADTAEHSALFTLAFAPGARAYFVVPETHRVRPYLLASYGIAFLSSKQFGNAQQAGKYSFQANLGAGVEIGKDYQGWDLNWRIVHYSNAGIERPNQGFDFLYVFSVGYLL